MPTVVAGRRAFVAASYLLVCFGAVHMIAVYQGIFTTPTSAPEIAMAKAARAVEVPMGPFRPTAFGGIQILNASYSVLLVYAGLVNLLLVDAAHAAGQLRRLTLINILMAWLLLMITVVFQFPPPMVFAAAVTILYKVSLNQQPTPSA